MGYLSYDEKKVLKWVNDELYNIITSTLKNKVRKSQLKVVQHYYFYFWLKNALEITTLYRS